MTIKYTDIQPVEDLLDGVRQVVAGHAASVYEPSMVGKTLSMESLSIGDEETMSQISSSLQNGLQDTVKAYFPENDAVPSGFTAQTRTVAMECANIGAILASNPAAAMAAAKKVANLANFQGVSIGRPAGQGDYYATNQMTTESFDNTNTRTVTETMMSFNLGAVRQSPFSQAFWTPVAVNPNEPGLLTTMRARYIMENVTHAADGSRTNFKRRPLVHALIDYTLLRDDETDIIPVYSTTAPATADKFVDPAVIAPINVMYHDVPVATSMLKFGADFNVLGISSIPELVARGLFTNRDQLDPKMVIKNVAFKFGNDVIRFSTRQYTAATLTSAVVGQSRLLTTQMLLNEEDSGLRLKASTKNISGGALDTLAAVASNGLTVRFGFRLSASFNLDMGNGAVDLPASSLTVISIRDANNNELDLTTGTGKAIADIIAAGVPLGYDLEARRSNTNKRQRGQFLDTQEFRKYFAVPVRAPITAVRPVGASDQEDAELMQTLLEGTYARAENDGVTRLFETFSDLMAVKSDTGAIIDVNSDFMGFASRLINVTAEEYTLDCRLIVDSLTSAGRTVDIQAAIVNNLRDVAYRGNVDSNYYVVLPSMYGGQNRKPTIVIGTDPRTAAYINIPGESRILGPEMNTVVVSTVDARMRNVIFMTFGDFSEETAGRYNPMTFGHFLIKPELVSNIQTTRGDETVRELTVAPSYYHMANLPVLFKFNVVGLEEVIAKNPVLFKNV